MYDSSIRLYILSILLIFPLSLQGQQSQDHSPDTVEVWSAKNTKNQWLHTVGLPVTLLGAGILARTDNEFFEDKEIAEEVQEHLPTFQTHLDNYLAILPIAEVYGLNIAGIQGKNNFANRTALLIKSELIMMTFLLPLKYFSHQLRPDGSNYSSFPSGHTAQAFVAATYMQKEYGDRNPWYSVQAYAIATSVGVLRILNNKHYTSDVLVGAAIGILSVNLAYMTHKYSWGIKQNSPARITVLPMYNRGNFGLAMNMTLH